MGERSALNQRSAGDTVEPGPLAHRADFTLGNATVLPSIRTVEGPGGRALAEPRVMQVLLSLVDAGGAVLSREDLIQRCWSGRVVSDDAVNRTIAGVRRLTVETQADFSVETIPKIGYRLISPGEVGPISTAAPPPATEAPPSEAGRSRRALVVGGAAAIVVGGVGGWALLRHQAERRYSEAIEGAKRALLSPGAEASTARRLTELATANADRPEAWGLLAYARYRLSERAPPGQAGSLVNASQKAARLALRGDPENPYALLTEAILQFSLADWDTTERRVRHVLAVSPSNVPAMDYLVVLLQSVGRCTESLAYLQRAIALEPLLPNLLFKEALKHWIFGRIPEADRVIDRALELWPRNELVWNARLLIYAFTGRESAALTMLDELRPNWTSMPPSTLELWRAALQALQTRAAPHVAKAREVILSAAPKGPANAGLGVMALSALGELDAAFAAATGLLVRRGSLVSPLQASNDWRLINSQSWRRTQWLFTPATSAMRADPRFRALSAELGLLKYWRSTGVWPDPFVRGAV